jgi:hypothetical protein
MTNRPNNYCTAGYGDFNDYECYIEFKRRCFNEANPVPAVGNQFSDCDFDSLCELHDDAMDCEDYTWAARIKAAILARPEYPAHQAEVLRLNQVMQDEFEARHAQPEGSEVPF